MPETTSEIQRIQSAIEALRLQVDQMRESDPKSPDATASAPAPAATATATAAPAPKAPPAPPAGSARAAPAPSAAPPAAKGKPEGADALAVLRAGMAELDGIATVEEVPRVFARLAARTGLRLLLLKLWRSGLQVLEARGVSLPPEAFRRGQDGRAPIPVQDDELFCVLSRDAAVYAGPVPLRRFPLDLTILLGQGEGVRQVVVLPLRVQGRWSAFLYLDADRGGERALGVAEILARYALARVLLLEKGVAAPSPAVAAILREELERRQERRARRLDGGSRPAPKAGASPAAPAPAGEEPDHFLDGDLEAACTSIADAARIEAERRRQEGAANAPEDIRQRAGVLTPEAVLRHTGELPALPKAAIHILGVIDDPRTTATRLERAIAMDQALTAKVLRIANSPFYGATREIKTVSEAIVRLGFMTIRNWTLVAATKSVFLTPGAGLLHRKVWRQSVLSAMAAQLVAQEVRHLDPESIFLGGLMQNIGQLVLARAEPDLFLQVLEESERRREPYHVVERDLLGFDHGELGGLLIREWNLSPELEEAVRDHHRLESDGPARRVAAMIALGEEIAATGGSADLGQPGYEASRSAAALGLAAEAYERLQVQARELNIDPRLFG